MTHLSALALASLMITACQPNPNSEGNDAAPTDAAASDTPTDTLSDQDGESSDLGDSSHNSDVHDADSQDTVEAVGPPNLVLVVLDDVGVEVVEPWATEVGATGDLAPIPTLTGLGDRGVIFTTAWATPTCSPTRWGLHTGLYPSRGGPLGPIGNGMSPVTATMDTLPGLLRDSYRTGLFGKWHLAGADAAPVTRGGWHHYAGSPSGGLPNYFDWSRTVVTETGEVTTAPDTRYATTALVDDALEWIDQQPTQSPWLVMLAFNAPHTPFHAPPAALRPTFSDADLDADSDGECDQNRDCFRAAIEALDTELGRFLDTATEFDGGRPTVVVVLGDNGSPGQVVQPPFTREHSKDSLYEGGVHVPLIISGPTSIIAGRGATDGLAHAAVDVFATLIELAGLSVPDGVDGVSLLPMLADPSSSVRETLYTDGSTSQNDPIEGAVLRDESYKVHWFDVSVPGHYGCYDLTEDVNETHDLIVNGAPPSICATLFDALLATR